MRIIAKKTLREFWESHVDAQHALETWYDDAKHATCRTPSDIKHVYASASILPNNRIVFNIKGNTYRLVVTINYVYGILYVRYVRFIGHHQEYDKIDATTI